MTIIIRSLKWFFQRRENSWRRVTLVTYLIDIKPLALRLIYLNIPSVAHTTNDFVTIDIAAELKTGAKASTETSGGRVRKIKPFKLQDAAKKLSAKEIKDLLHITYKRILKSDSKYNLHVYCHSMGLFFAQI